MNIRQPETEADFSAYYQLRWEMLRAPWHQPLGSERDDREGQSFHLLAEDETGQLVGVARLHWNTPELAQIRYMAVNEHHQRRGIGKELLEQLEKEAARRNSKEILLHARESVTKFYLANGYQIVEPSHLLFGEIQHYLMRKTISK